MEFTSFLLTLNKYSSLFLAIVTAIYVYFIYHSFKLSQKDYEVKNRPYLSITKDISLPLKDGGTKFIFEIKNSGRTPAQLLSLETSFLKCEDPGERFSNPHGYKKLNQKAILSTGQNTTFTVDSPSDEKVGLEIKIKYRGIVFRKIFGTKVLFKLEKRIVYPIDSYIN
ncbi:MAG: hypothetical protein ABH804_01905 [archaeon]